MEGLPGVGLVGQIPGDTLGRLSQLRVLSLRSNRLTGQIPSDFANLSSARNIYLQSNQLSGEFPASLTKLPRLTRLDLSVNNFLGPIPFALNNLTMLTGLFLENNSFSGKLPSIDPSSLLDFSVANNDLNGSIPASLARFPPSSFAGNLDLCGEPLANSCNPFFPSSAPSLSNPSGFVKQKSRKLSTGVIIAIVVGCGAILLLLLLCLFLFLRRRRARQTAKAPKPVGVLEEGTTVVVKRLKDVVVSKKDFEAQLGVMGKVKTITN